MKCIIDYFRGCVRLRLRGCEPERCLQDLLHAGVAFWSTEKPEVQVSYRTHVIKTR